MGLVVRCGSLLVFIGGVGCSLSIAVCWLLTVVVGLVFNVVCCSLCVVFRCCLLVCVCVVRWLLCVVVV